MHWRPLVLVLAAASWAGACSRADAPPGRLVDASLSDHAAPDAADAREAAAPLGPPYLVDLGVAPAPLVPAFSPDIHDYYVRCTAGANALTVSLKASPGATARLAEPKASAKHAEQSLAVQVEENQAIVAEASRGTTTVSYWVRCLPHDFPDMAMTRASDAGVPTPGYYLVGTSWILGGDDAAYAMVLDGHGVPVWYRRHTGHGVFDVDAIVPGSVSFIPGALFVVNEPFEIDALSSGATTEVAPVGYPTDFHELRVLPSGRFVVLSSPEKTGVDLTGLSLPAAGGASQALGPGSTIADCVVVEMDASGAVLSTWVASDHLNAVNETVSVITVLGADAGTGSPGAAVYDVFHCNSIDIDPANGDYLVSARQMNAIFDVDRATGAVLWKMGGTASVPDGAAYVNVTDPFVEQHDARFLPGWSSACGGSGRISLFDDESSTSNPARAVVYDVVVGASGADAGCDAGASGIATVAWEHKGLVPSAAAGSFRITPDGSRVIGWGFGAAPDPVFTEVDEQGHELLRFDFPDGHVSYRALKVPLTAFDLGSLRKTAGL